MILGTGVDIVVVSRIAQSIERHGDRFLNRIYTSSERAYCDGMREPAIHYAARWAAKEALLKAIGTGMREGVKMKDIEVLKMDTGQPRMTLTGRAGEIAEGLGSRRIHVSLTHDAGMAVAMVILED